MQCSCTSGADGSVSGCGNVWNRARKWNWRGQYELLGDRVGLKFWSLFVETYGTERGSGTADDITKDLKIELECRSGAVAVPRAAGYQETAAYCQFQWEPCRKKIASTSKALGTVL